MKKLVNLEKFIYLVIFLLPSYLIKIDVFSVPTNALEILIISAFIWAMLLKIRLRKFLQINFWTAVGLILAGLVISTLINKNYAVGFGIIKGWFVLPMIFAAITTKVISAERKKNIYLAFYFSATAVAAISLIYYFSGEMTFDSRLQGIFNSPNYLAMYLAPALIIGTIFAYDIKQKKAFWAISYAIITVAFYLTYSYAAWAAIIVALAVSIGARNRNNFKKMVIFAVLVFAIFLSQWSSQKFIDFRNVSERSSASSRIMIWRSAGKIIADNWVWGIGPGNFQDKYLEYQKYFPAYLEWAVPHPHNLYLAFWLYSGFIGLLGFLLLLALWFKAMADKEKNTLWFVSLGIMLYFLLHGMVDATYFKNDLAAVFWLNFLILF